jgi:RNA polymerase sigma-70 factor (ECF subfamily)
VPGAKQWDKGAIAHVQAVGFGQPALMLVDGAVGLVLAPRGKVSRALKFTIKDEIITQIEVITEQSRLNQLDLVTLTN